MLCGSRRWRDFLSSKSEELVDPDPVDFVGDAFRPTAKRLFHATRPKFFPASVLPVAAGTAFGVMAGQGFDGLIFFLAMLATVSVHAASNVLNDVGDENIGTDRLNESRIYPYTGGSRFIQTGILDSAAMARLGTTLLAVAAACGAALLFLKGPMVLLFGVVGVALGVFYSLGPAKLSSLGLGEVAVAIAFGVLPVSGAAWLQGADLNSDLLLFSVPISIWVAAILLINGVPDIAADQATGKRTLAVRLGLNGTAILYLLIHVLAVVVILILTMQQVLPLLAPVVPAGSLLLAAGAAKSIRRGVEDRPGMTTAIESTLAIHTLGSLWLTACVLFALFWPAA
jgi:1,4-dihydroxy-2-naphthoate octaprenyltransferase